MKKLMLLAGVLALSGCAINQTVKPVQAFSHKEVCLIENPAVRAGFIEQYKRSLESKGYSVRRMPTTASIQSCPVISTYTATWRWDLATYMAYAEINVFVDGKPSGQAKYDSQSGGANMGKFIAAEKKIAELVDQLFPGGAGS
jgi:hypothetical protein